MDTAILHILLTALLSIVITIIGFFLGKTYNRIDKLEDRITTFETNIKDKISAFEIEIRSGFSTFDRRLALIEMNIEHMLKAQEKWNTMTYEFMKTVSSGNMKLSNIASRADGDQNDK